MLSSYEGIDEDSDYFPMYLAECPPINLSNGDDCKFYDRVRKANAMMSRYMSIPFPELLDDDTWCEKYRQLDWLLEANHLPVKLKKDGE